MPRPPAPRGPPATTTAAAVAVMMVMLTADRLHPRQAASHSPPELIGPRAELFLLLLLLLLLFLIITAVSCPSPSLSSAATAATATAAQYHPIGRVARRLQLRRQPVQGGHHGLVPSSAALSPALVRGRLRALRIAATAGGLVGSSFTPVWIGSVIVIVGVVVVLVVVLPRPGTTPEEVVPDDVLDHLLDELLQQRPRDGVPEHRARRMPAGASRRRCTGASSPAAATLGLGVVLFLGGGPPVELLLRISGHGVLEDEDGNAPSCLACRAARTTRDLALLRSGGGLTWASCSVCCAPRAL